MARGGLADCKGMAGLRDGACGMDGYTFIQRARPKTEAPIVVVNAGDDVLDIVSALEAGADVHVIKPLDRRRGFFADRHRPSVRLDRTSHHPSLRLDRTSPRAQSPQ